MPRFSLASVCIALAAVLLLPGTPRAQDAQLLGEEIAKFDRETDTFDVDSRAGPFDQIKIQAERAAIELFRVRVTFGNGERQDFDRKRTIEAGRIGHTLELRGRDRRISRVETTYRTIGSRTGRRAIVSLFHCRG